MECLPQAVVDVIRFVRRIWIESAGWPAPGWLPAQCEYRMNLPSSAIWSSRSHKGLFYYSFAMPLLVFAFGLFVTEELWRDAQRSAQQALQTQFDFGARQVSEAVVDRMKTYKQVLRGVQGLYEASASVERGEFRDYVASLRLAESYPGIQGVRFSPLVRHGEKDQHVAAMRRQGFPGYAIHPEGRRELYTPVAYIEPYDERNRVIFGYDTYSDLEHPRPGDMSAGLRHAAMDKARDTGRAAISGKIRLVFEKDQDAQYGFLMFLPVYKRGMPHGTVEERRANIAGWVSLVFRVGDLMRGILGAHGSEFDIELYDGKETSDRTRMYDSNNLAAASGAARAKFHTSIPLDVAGREWTVAIHSLPRFESMLDTHRPRLVILSGIAVSLLLSLVTLLLVHGRRRALESAALVDRESRKNETLLRAASDGIYVLDAAGNVVQANDAFCRMLGYTHDEIMAMNVAQWCARCQAEGPEKVIAGLLGSGTLFEGQHRRRDGSMVSVEVSTIGVEIDGRGLLYCSARDITARKEAERAVVESGRKLGTIIETALDAVVMMDDDGIITGWNAQAERIFGWPRDEAVGRALHETIIPPRYREAHVRGMNRFLDTGTTTVMNSRIELSALHRNGHEFPIELTIASIRTEGGCEFSGFIRDITERKQVQQDLEEREERYRRLVESSPDVIYTFSLRNGGIYYSPRVEQVLGYSREYLYAHPMLWNESIHPEDRALVGEVIRRFGEGVPFDVEYRIRDAQGDWHWVRDRSIGRRVIGDEVLIEGLATDISERKRVENELRIAAKAFESQECMFITDADGVIQRVNKAFVEATGYSAEEAVGKKPSILESTKHDAEFYRGMWSTLLRDGYWQGEIWRRHKNGEVYPGWQTISAVADPTGRITHYICTFADISELKEAEEKIRDLAYYDPLTRLSNRRHLLDRLQKALALNLRNGRQGALLFMDIDNFKDINDTQGHDVGDLLLIELAKRLQGCVRAGDTTARLGGDEFVVLLEDLNADEPTAAAQAETVGEKILAAVRQPCLINGSDYHSTVSIGIALFSGEKNTAEEMLKRADVALYQAKAEGRNTLRFFDLAMQTLIAARVALESDLRRAVLEQEQFSLYYQPQVDSSGRLIGAEALLRWQHPERGMVSPAKFIPLAEESGLILPLGHWVLSTACRQLAAWVERPETAHLTLAVNVSAKQFRLPTFADEVLNLVDYFRIDPARLKLEVTESLLLDSVDDTIAKMALLEGRGIRFSMDDFGTGYSSLSYLKRLPLYQLKIDQSFVRDVLTDPNDVAIIKTIIALAQSMSLGVIAEGVETEAQRRFLEANGCHAFQGYLFSKPVPIEDFERLVAAMNPAGG